MTPPSVAVFVAVDHCSAECVSIHAALHEALEPIRQGVTARFGGVKKKAAEGLVAVLSPAAPRCGER